MRLANKTIIAHINNILAVDEMALKLPGRIGYTMAQNKKRLMAAYNEYLQAKNEIDRNDDKEAHDADLSELLEAEVEVAVTVVSPEPLFAETYEPKIFELLDFMLEGDV